MSAKINIIQNGYSYEEKIIMNSCDVFNKNNGTRKSPENLTIEVQRANGSCCLIRSSGSTILFDTMGPWERDLLLERLASLKVHPDDVDYVIGSHGHPDHIGNMNLFQKCKRHFIGIASYSKDMYYKDCFIEPIERKSEENDDINHDNDDEGNDIGDNNHDNNGTNPSFITTYLPDFKIDNNLTIVATPGHTSDDVSLIINNCDEFGTVALAGDLFERAEDVNNEQIWLSAGSANPDSQRYNRKRLLFSVDWILPGHGPIFSTKLAHLTTEL